VTEIKHVYEVRPRKDHRASIQSLMRSHSADYRMVNRMQSATQSAMHNCAVGLGFRVCSPYRHGRDRCTPKPGKKKQKRYDYARAVLIIHRFPFSLLLTLVAP